MKAEAAARPAEAEAAAIPTPGLPTEIAPSRDNPPAPLARHQRLIVWGGISAVTAIAWLVLAHMPMPTMGMHGGAMAEMAGAMGAGAVAWPLHDAWLIFAMWTVMMTAMMLPSANPMLEMYARIARSMARVWVFAAGYLIAWAGFAAATAVAQYALQHAHIVVETMRLESFAGALLLIAAGIYQFTSLKQACLTQCRSPLGFFMTRWRPGARGALAMGLGHGAFCVGCCWLLMAPMWVAGAMNLAWAIALTMFVLLEKATPWGVAFSRASGAVMVASGLALAVLG